MSYALLDLGDWAETKRQSPKFYQRGKQKIWVRHSLLVECVIKEKIQDSQRSFELMISIKDKNQRG